MHTHGFFDMSKINFSLICCYFWPHVRVSARARALGWRVSVLLRRPKGRLTPPTYILAYPSVVLMRAPFCICILFTFAFYPRLFRLHSIAAVSNSLCSIAGIIFL